MFGLGRSRQPAGVDLHPPFPGEVIPVGDVPDPVFSARMVGDGFAVVPPDDATHLDVCAPVSGRLVTLFTTLHAFAVVSGEGLEVLVHIGLDTVELQGAGFRALVEQGAEVTAGQPVVRVDATAVRESGRPLVTPVVMTQKKQVAELSVTPGPAAPGDVVCTVRMTP